MHNCVTKIFDKITISEWSTVDFDIVLYYRCAVFNQTDYRWLKTPKRTELICSIWSYWFTATVGVKPLAVQGLTTPPPPPPPPNNMAAFRRRHVKTYFLESPTHICGIRGLGWVKLTKFLFTFFMICLMISHGIALTKQLWLHWNMGQYTCLNEKLNLAVKEQLLLTKYFKLLT